MAFAQVPEKREEEFLTNFFLHSAFTIEGIDISTKEYRKEVEKCFREVGYDKKNFEALWFKGSVMNRVYSLTEQNAYPDDLTFLVVPNFYNIKAKLSMGARWFDDIVCNNKIKQNAIDCGIAPDFDVEENDE